MKNMRKGIIITLLILIQVFLLSVFTFAYPISYYDTDLDIATRNEILRKFNEGEAKRKRIDDKNDDSVSNSNLTSDDIEDDFIKYEDTDTEVSETEISNTYNYRIINKNIPDFNVKDYPLETFENYSALDSLGRCGVVTALLGKETMPADGESRGSIGMVKPSGWQTPIPKYDFIDGKYLYNRCHLIGWQLSAENNNVSNLITGTRWLNKMGMLPFENKVASYIRQTNNHVLYRATPIFEGKNLLASRVQLEALSYEDNGEGIKFNVLLENYQPGVHIDYATGSNYEEVSKN